MLNHCTFAVLAHGRQAIATIADSIQRRWHYAVLSGAATYCPTHRVSAQGQHVDSEIRTKEIHHLGCRCTLQAIRSARRSYQRLTAMLIVSHNKLNM